MFPIARLRRGLLALLILSALVVPVTAASRPRVPAPAPARLAPLTAATLPRAYAANRADILRAAGEAAASGAAGRAARLRVLAEDGRQFLTFDGRGSGRTAEVLGDLARADRIAVLVPGADTDLDTYDELDGRPPAGLSWRDGAASSCAVSAANAARADHRSLGGAALDLRRELCRQDPAARVAVVTWIGYDTPSVTGPAVLTDGRARTAASALREFLGTLRRIDPRAEMSLLCHSYGSVVCGQAAPGLDVADIALFGSPGVAAPDVAALRTPATVWAGRGGSDWIADVPHISIGLPGGSSLGFGQDPLATRFGAHRFPAGDGGHSDYFAPGSLSLQNLARIVLDRRPEAVHV
ncbi:alpha/beta hydrolase [Streptomyces sp. WAC06614]|uniref:alpha/beta hydrolase n=1 Tax=Streptomyces sp. WAC06614 TaxID=2487416 RepID=UPI000F76A306|nr:alpha/beta hydrolase [Streptomyces sp. WAC06614]RSS64837.1 hypothetical protein EF918_30145 [Streptomyces sp. WAC06614]